MKAHRISDTILRKLRASQKHIRGLVDHDPDVYAGDPISEGLRIYINTWALGPLDRAIAEITKPPTPRGSRRKS